MNASSEGDNRGRNGVTQVPERLWVAMIVRAIPAAAAALVITFSQDHNPVFAYFVFGGFALASGVLIGFEAIGVPQHPSRGWTFARSIYSALAGGAALVFGAVPHLATSTGFLWHLAGWAIVTGLIEIASGIATRRQPLFSRETYISGALTLLLGILVAFIPPDLNHEYGGIENVAGSLTAIVQAVGYFGAYAALLAIVLVVEGITLRSITRRAMARDADTNGTANAVEEVEA